MARTLRVWEKGTLHGKSSAETSIVEWGPDEYDFATIEHGNLVIQKLVRDPLDPNRQIWLTVGFIVNGNWMKYSLDEVDDVNEGSESNKVATWDVPDTRPDEPMQPTDFDDIRGQGVPPSIGGFELDTSIGSFARADDPFHERPYEAPVDRPNTGNHAAPDEPQRAAGDPYVTTVANQPYDGERSTVITKEMREKVLERLNEHVPPKKPKDDPASTTLLGLDATTMLPVLGDREVFKD